MRLSEAIDKLVESVPDNTSRRFDCPRCRGTNTFSITRLGSEVSYNCFRNSCSPPLKGFKKIVASMDSVKSRFKGRTEVKEVFAMPNHWVQGIASEKCLKMLINTNSLPAYTKDLFKVAYDPLQDRLCYMLLDKDKKVVGAVGRALNNARPKTWNYPNSAPVPFVVGGTKKIVLVEDCASACAVTISPDYSGMALLGTSLKEEYIPFINKYDNVIVALDYDARKKALDIKNKLSYYCKDVRVIVLGKDLKNMTKEEILNVLK